MQPLIAAVAIAAIGKTTLLIRSPRILSSFHRKGFCIDSKSTALEEYRFGKRVELIFMKPGLK
jgi:hypothetical protein